MTAANPSRPLALTEAERTRAHEVAEMATRGASALGDLVMRLDDASWTVRRAVVAALASMGDPAVGRLCDILREHRDNETRLAAAVDALVASSGDVETAALRLAESETPAVTCDAAQILGRRRSARAVPKLAALAADPDDNVALAAIEALGRIGDDASVTPLIAAVEGQNFFRLFPAIDVLGRSGNARAVRPLLSLLDKPHYAIEAVRALGRLGDAMAILPLVGLLAKASDTMVRAAAIAIGGIHDRQVEHYGHSGGVAAALERVDVRKVTGRIVHCLTRADGREQAELIRFLSWIGGEGAIVALVDMLSADTSAAQSAAAALRQLGTAAEPQLLSALSSADSERRLMILPLLGHASAVVEPVAACLSDPHPSVRALACEALARVGDATVVVRLFALLADADARVSQSAAAAIQSLGSATTERLALDAARSGDARVRRAGLRIIAYFGYPSAVDVLIGAMEDPDERIRDASIFGLPFVDDARATDALLRAAVHISAKTRAAAMRAMGQAAGQPRTIAALRGGLGDADPWVRYFACQALSRLNDEGSAGLISELFADPAGQVRVSVVEALAHLRGARALDALHRAAEGADADVQRAALLGLGHVKNPSSLPVLRRALQAEDPATRLVAASALAEYDLPDITLDLGAALGDVNDSVRAAAVTLLATRPGAEATRVLVGQLGNRSIQARIVAALTQPAEGRIAVLAESLRRADAETAALVVSVLSRSRSAEATLVLEDAFASAAVEVRRAVAPALLAMGTTSSRALLARAATHDPDDEVRRISAAAAEG
jgi:HEAT repeat protein